jgi:putative ABC transport system ATP-binding protein
MNTALPEPVLRAHGVRKDFQDGRDTISVLKGVSLSLRPGEAVVLEGPSGSGKTTLLSILGCILSPTSGEVFIEGQRVDPSQPSRLAALRKKYIGFVFQQFNLFGALTAQENVEYALNLKGTSGSKARKEAARWMELVGLHDRRHFLPRDLSGGQKQRVAIARALAGSSQVILADEPTANLDFHTGQKVLELFRQLAREHQRALLIVTHDPRVRPIIDRTLYLKDGILTDTNKDIP